MTDERTLALIPGLQSFGNPDQALERLVFTESGSHLVLEGDHRQVGRLGDESEVFADEVNRDVGLLQATLHDRHQLAGHQRQRLLGDDRVPQLDQLAPQLVALRFEVRSRGGQKDRLRICGSLGAVCAGSPRYLSTWEIS